MLLLPRQASRKAEGSYRREDALLCNWVTREELQGRLAASGFLPADWSEGSGLTTGTRRPPEFVGQHSCKPPIFLGHLVDHDVDVLWLLAQQPDERVRNLSDQLALLFAGDRGSELYVNVRHASTLL